MPVDHRKRKRRTRGRARFKKRDAVRAVKATMEATGLAVSRVEIDPHTGKISVIVGEPDRASTTENPWDEVLTDAADKKRPA
jgi:hypothetical protein